MYKRFARLFAVFSLILVSATPVSAESHAIDQASAGSCPV